MNPLSVNPVIALSAAREAARAEAIEAGRRRRRRQGAPPAAAPDPAPASRPAGALRPVKARPAH